jgi:hypothetical protein
LLSSRDVDHLLFPPQLLGYETVSSGSSSSSSGGGGDDDDEGRKKTYADEAGDSDAE